MRQCKHRRGLVPSGVDAGNLVKLHKHSERSMSTAEGAAFQPAGGLLAQLDLLRIELAGPVAHVRLNRPAKRNAISDTLITQLHTAFVNLPEQTRAAVLT